MTPTIYIVVKYGIINRGKAIDKLCMKSDFLRVWWLNMIENAEINGGACLTKNKNKKAT